MAKPPLFSWSMMRSLLLWACLPGAASADLIVDSYTANHNDRFTGHGDFIMVGFDLSGVAQDSNGRWATAISNNVILSAFHYAPSGTLTFFPGNDSSATAITRDITSGMRVAGTDLYLAVLDAALPNSIAHYRFATTPLNATPDDTIQNAGTFQGQTAFLIGRSPENHPHTSDQAVGQNRIAGYVENANFQGNANNDALVFDQTDADVSFEAELRVGDSGAPSFLDQGGGNLLLLGTNAFNLTDNMKNIVGSGINYTGNQTTAINHYIAANAIPEPSALILAGLASLTLCHRHRRRYQRHPV